MITTLAKTPLHDWHAGHGGRMVDFAGWSMPVQYTSIVAEHTATRTAAGLFDVSHMGRLKFAGSDVAMFLDSLVTRRVADMPVGQVRYALVTNEAGGVLDDVLVYHLSKAKGGWHYLMVVNASNREKIVDWISHLVDDHADVRCSDVTVETAMIAVQGPLAVGLVQQKIGGGDLAQMKYYHAEERQIAGQDAIVSRTGYTGEDGFELIVPASAALEDLGKYFGGGSGAGGDGRGAGSAAIRCGWKQGCRCMVTS